MKALILNGAVALRDMADAVDDALGAELAACGYDVSRHDLATLGICDCLGDFGCWTVTPGVCVQPGAHREVARDVIQSDLVAWLTPVTFGGYSSRLKRQLDHCIPLISPRFARVQGETHHEPRYERFPSVLAVGLMDRPDPAATHVFERLVRRNVINMHARHFASPVVTRQKLPRLGTWMTTWLDDLSASALPQVAAAPLDLSARSDLPLLTPRRALVLVGSPRGGASISAALATHLEVLLGERGLEVTTAWIHRSLRTDPGLVGLAAALRESDVVALASPLYVDSLPGPVVEAFEILGRQRSGAVSSRPRFLAMVNCGFPEAAHTDTALAICRLFAEEAGLEWIGGLGIGGGGMLAGGPLPEQGGRARVVTRALALTANAICEGRTVPEKAQKLVRALPVPTWLYRFFADRGFAREAKQHGTRERLGERPYATPEGAPRARADRER